MWGALADLNRRGWRGLCTCLLPLCRPGDRYGGLRERGARIASRRGGRSVRKLGSELRWPLHEIGGPDPEALEAAKRGIGALEVPCGKPSLRQHLCMKLMHRRQAFPQSDPLLGEPDVNHASIMQRTLLREIAVLDHLFDIVRNVRAQITAA